MSTTPKGPNRSNQQDRSSEPISSNESNSQRKNTNKRQNFDGDKYFKPSELTESIIDRVEKGQMSIIFWLLTLIHAPEGALEAEEEQIIHDQIQQNADEKGQIARANKRETEKKALLDDGGPTKKWKTETGNITTQLSRIKAHLREIGKNQVILRDHEIILNLVGIIKSIIQTAAEKNICIDFDAYGPTINAIDPCAHLLPSEHVAPARSSSTSESSVEWAHVSPIFGGSATSPDSSSAYSPATPNSYPRFGYSNNRPPFKIQPHPPAICSTYHSYNTNFDGSPNGVHIFNQYSGASASINTFSQVPFATAHQTPNGNAQAAVPPASSIFGAGENFGKHQQQQPPPPPLLFPLPSQEHRTSDFGGARENPRSLPVQRAPWTCQQPRNWAPASPEDGLNIPAGPRASHGPAKQSNQLPEDHGTGFMSPALANMSSPDYYEPNSGLYNAEIMEALFGGTSAPSQQAHSGPSRCGAFDNSNLAGLPITIGTTSNGSAFSSNPHVNSLAIETGRNNNGAAMNEQRQGIDNIVDVVSMNPTFDYIGELHPYTDIFGMAHPTPTDTTLHRKEATCEYSKKSN